MVNCIKEMKQKTATRKRPDEKSFCMLFVIFYISTPDLVGGPSLQLMISSKVNESDRIGALRIWRCQVRKGQLELLKNSEV